MKDKHKDKDKRKCPVPVSNVSMHYYTDPVYSTDAFYGYDEEPEPRQKTPLREEQDDSLDEPIESWGWVNSTD